MKREELLRGLKFYLSVAWENEEEFLELFARMGEPTDLTRICMSDTLVEFAYILHSGQHVCSHIPVEEYLDWVRNVCTKKVMQV